MHSIEFCTICSELKHFPSICTHTNLHCLSFILSQNIQDIFDNLKSIRFVLFGSIDHDDCLTGIVTDIMFYTTDNTITVRRLKPSTTQAKDQISYVHIMQFTMVLPVMHSVLRAFSILDRSSCIIASSSLKRIWTYQQAQDNIFRHPV